MIEWYTRDGGTVGFKVIDEQRRPAMTTNKHPCPACGGIGAFNTHHNTGSDSAQHYWAPTACWLCEGRGTVSQKTLANVDAGKQMRQRMREHGVGMYALGQVLGVRSSDISSALYGRLSLPDLFRRAADALEKKEPSHDN